MKFLSNASFWVPDFYSETGWEAHIPFAFYLVETLRPKRIVELGTYNGLSYFAFCQAVAWLGLDATTIAIDNWAGDQGGFRYGEDVYESVIERNKQYPFSRLIRANFSDAVDHIEDGSVDLLHIDGDHLYESVSADFRNYRPKLTPDAIVIFHDTRLGGHAGVWKLFEELEYPKFEFFHACGLGMIAVGKIKDEMRPWFEGPRQHLDWMRRAYGMLGDTIVARSKLDIDARVKAAQYLADQTAWMLTA